MQFVDKVAVVDREKCTACMNCIRVCPVEAVSLDKSGPKPVSQVDDQQCLACTICMTRCPEQAIRMIARAEPLYFGIDHRQADAGQVERLCRAAHMYPEQIICYCRRTQAREVAAVILLGHHTPEALSRATGVRTGCGVLCITSVLRLLKAAGVELDKAPGWQWYNAYLTIWDLPPEIIAKYPEYFLPEDLAAMNQVFPKGD
ncbi:MAG: 4Fe-4S dicluster domain-containing protein [Desulfarculus sp.]|jgi:ferredoxin|nr:MAG: 4Fe-4S dicluster domain-containing protein [Desulfarculus sp.]